MTGISSVYAFPASLRFSIISVLSLFHHSLAKGKLTNISNFIDLLFPNMCTFLNVHLLVFYVSSKITKRVDSQMLLVQSY